ncbi:hypothetical protein [Methylobacterium durans]|uniref:hypothetical protein n=1 Tax=Methylobacterium durans TaxID=2202825 RepID=UPI0013A54E26|nr:hypothetical protein [Methylobacterium durans]
MRDPVACPGVSVLLPARRGIIERQDRIGIAGHPAALARAAPSRLRPPRNPETR